MNWSKGFEARYYMTIVDARSWRDREKIKITGGSVSRSEGGLRESADISCKSYDKGEQWIRIWMDARQEGAAEHIALFTGLATSPDDDIDGPVTSNSLECYSVLKPAEDVLLPRGWYAPKGASASILIMDLLKVTPAPVTITGNAPRLMQNIIAEENESHLSMIDKILLAINWRIRIAGDGSILVSAPAETPSARYSVTENDSVEPKLTKSLDWYSCPNVLRVVSNDQAVTIRDDSETSQLSVQNRGREIWAEESSCELSDGETLYEYARRRLKELQKVSENISYDRRFNPDLMVTDLVNLHYPEKKIDGDYYITSQRIELGYGAKTTEEVVK